MAVVGIGCDLVAISRIAAIVQQQGERFCERILTPAERVVYAQRSAGHAERGLRYLATRFAAKEAFAKAIGTGIRPPLDFQSVAVHNDELGAPHFSFDEAWAARLAERGWQCWLSLSDDRDWAMAMVVIEGGDQSLYEKPMVPENGDGG